MEDLFQLESVNGEVLFACNICDEGYDTETDVMKHLNIHHTEILQKIFKQSKGEDVHGGLKSVKDNNPEEPKCQEQNEKTEKQYKCVVCSIAIPESSYKEVNEHILQHLQMSGKTKGKKDNIETNLDDSDIYAGFDQDGNRIAEPEN